MRRHAQFAHMSKFTRDWKIKKKFWDDLANAVSRIKSNTKSIAYNYTESTE